MKTLLVFSTLALALVLAAPARCDTSAAGYDRMIAALKAGDAATMNAMLAAGFDVNFVPEGKPSVLGVAVSAKNHDAARSLIEHGADVNRHEGFYQGTAIMFAADNDDIEMVDLLLEHGADVNRRDAAYGDPAINWAAYSGRTDMVKHLLDKGADPTLVGHGNSLEIAMRRGFQPLVELLAEHMKKTRRLSAAETQLASAIEHGDDDEARQALAVGAAPDSLDRFGRPLIAEAARRGQIGILKLLVAAGADVDAPDPIGYTALMEAARDQQVESVRTLLELGADLNHVSLEHGLALTPLHLAAIGGSVETVEMLVEHGAKLDVKGTIGTTPLLWGLFEGSLDAGKRLIELGADPTLSTTSGYSAEDYARDYEKKDLAAAIAAWKQKRDGGT